MLIEVYDTGELTEIHDLDYEFKDDSTYLFVSIYDKTCYMWFGANSSIKKNFVAAKEARNIIMDTGFSSSRIHEDGTEDQFHSALDQWKHDKTKYERPAGVITEQRERLKRLFPDTHVEPPNSRTSKKAKRKTVTNQKRKKSKTRKETTPKTKSNEIANKTDQPSDDDLEYILSKINEQGELEGYELDYLITKGYVYSVVYDEEKPMLQYLEDVKDGVFEVQDYLPRFYIENSRLLAIELWRNLE